MSTTPVASIPASNQTLMMNLGLKAGVGVVSGGLLALLTARKTGARLFVTGLATGTGFGYGWAQNDFHLKHPALVKLPANLEDEVKVYWDKAQSLVPDFAKFK